VVAVNDGVVGSPELVNSDPYGAGWLVRVRLTNPAGLDALMDRDAYVAYLAGLDQA
jgi:glycine cleavage system H protein